MEWIIGISISLWGLKKKLNNEIIIDLNHITTQPNPTQSNPTQPNPTQPISIPFKKPLHLGKLFVVYNGRELTAHQLHQLHSLHDNKCNPKQFQIEQSSTPPKSKINLKYK
jgi:hypothetical protein